MSRRLARETALQVLFQLDVNGDKSDIENVVRHWAEEFAVPEQSVPFALELVKGTLENQQEIDEKLGGLSEGWGLNRMANVDRNLLRLATYEILYHPEIPGRVTMNEAIEIAKIFGSGESGKFINGILDKIVASVQKMEEKSE
jgi:N utilization substance protein B